MRIFDRHWLLPNVAIQMRRKAIMSPTYNGLATDGNMELIRRLTADHVPTGSRLIFTRDEGMHSSGWWKNPDYERCWHLSLSFFDVITGERASKNQAVTDQWLDAFYGDDKRYVWAEPPFSQIGKRDDTWHYRVFCDEGWQPIKPRGEVYSRELTEAGWKSFSELKGAHAEALDRPLHGGAD